MGWRRTEKEGGLHPERAPAVGQQNFQPGKIDGHVVDVDRIAVLVARARENRGTGVKHDGHAIGFGGAVDDFQFLYAVQIVVGKQQLVRRVDLDHLNAEPQDLLHIGENVGSVPRMQAAAGKQARRIFLHIVGDELIHAAGEADHFRGNVVDEHGAIDAARVEKLEERFGERQNSTIWSKFGRFFFMSSSAWGLNISMGWMWMWQSVIIARYGMRPGEA